MFLMLLTKRIRSVVKIDTALLVGGILHIEGDVATTKEIEMVEVGRSVFQTIAEHASDKDILCRIIRRVNAEIIAVHQVQRDMLEERRTDGIFITSRTNRVEAHS